jgi:hypothetical protein
LPTAGKSDAREAPRRPPSESAGLPSELYVMLMLSMSARAPSSSHMSVAVSPPSDAQKAWKSSR